MIWMHNGDHVGYTLTHMHTHKHTSSAHIRRVLFMAKPRDAPDAPDALVITNPFPVRGIDKRSFTASHLRMHEYAISSGDRRICMCTFLQRLMAHLESEMFQNECGHLAALFVPPGKSNRGEAVGGRRWGGGVGRGAAAVAGNEQIVYFIRPLFGNPAFPNIGLSAVNCRVCWALDVITVNYRICDQCTHNYSSHNITTGHAAA